MFHDHVCIVRLLHVCIVDHYSLSKSRIDLRRSRTFFCHKLRNHKLAHRLSSVALRVAQKQGGKPSCRAAVSSEKNPEKTKAAGSRHGPSGPGSASRFVGYIFQCFRQTQLPAAIALAILRLAHPYSSSVCAAVLLCVGAFADTIPGASQSRAAVKSVVGVSFQNSVQALAQARDEASMSIFGQGNSAPEVRMRKSSPSASKFFATAFQAETL